MKELSIEEKAKRYDEARKKIAIRFGSNVADEIFSQFEMSEDERIRKELLNAFQESEDSLYMVLTPHRRESFIAWLEKQGEQNLVNTDLDELVIELEETIGTSPHSRETIKDFFQRAVQKYMNCLRIANGEIGRLVDENYLLKEKQGEQKPCMIQWKGDNLKEVIDFTGKDKNFEKWFKSFEEYEKYVHDHDGIFKLFNTDGSHYEVPVGAWIVKTPDGYNVASKAKYKQNLADKIEPKFKVGDTIYYNSFGEVKSMLVADVVTDSTDNPMYEDKEGNAVFEKDIIEQKSAWSEEDEDILNTIINHFKVDIECTDEDDTVRWLKSLKDRVQPKQEWSKEDEEMFNSIVARLHSHPNVDLEEYSKEYNWLNYTLKSLKDRSTWKPSDEQMEALKHAINCYSSISPTNTEEVYTLEIMKEQLKKLSV